MSSSTSRRGPTQQSSSTNALPNNAQPTTTQTQTLNTTSFSSNTALQPVLHLRGVHREGRDRPKIKWAEDVVDNEGLGRKKSKVCCIYHKPRGVGESDSESSDSSDEGSGDEGGDGGGKGCEHSHGKKGKGRSRSPNAYEKMPRVKREGGGSSREDVVKQ